MNQTILDTENPNIKIGLRTNGTQLQTFKQVTSTTGEENIDADTTVEIITITRTLLTTTS